MCEPIFAGTHCKPNETVYFSCTLKKSLKIVSLCGSVSLNLNEKEDARWLQYRFGKSGKLEFTFPLSKRNSLRKFDGDWHYHKAIGSSDAYVNFNNLNTTYTVLHYEMDDGKNSEEFSGIKIRQGNLKEVSLACNDVPTDNLREATGMLEPVSQ